MDPKGEQRIEYSRSPEQDRNQEPNPSPDAAWRLAKQRANAHRRAEEEPTE